MEFNSFIVNNLNTVVQIAVDDADLANASYPM